MTTLKTTNELSFDFKSNANVFVFYFALQVFSPESDLTSTPVLIDTCMQYAIIPIKNYVYFLSIISQLHRVGG